jgi:hypothetical protein
LSVSIYWRASLANFSILYWFISNIWCESHLSEKCTYFSNVLVTALSTYIFTQRIDLNFANFPSVFQILIKTIKMYHA